MSGYKLAGWVKDERTGLEVKDFTPIAPAMKAAFGQNVGDEYTLLKYCSTPENQAQLNSCVANATVGALELLENVSGKGYVDLSRLFTYYNARVPDNQTGIDQGTYVRNAFASLSSLGTCEEKIWDYNVDKVSQRPSWEAYEAAYAHKINAYYQITTDNEDRFAEMESALSSNHPIVFGAKVYAQIENSTGEIELPKDGEKSIGGHAMVVVGFNRATRKFLIRNSWGEQWGNKGYAWAPYEYLSEQFSSDLWVPTLFSF